MEATAGRLLEEKPQYKESRIQTKSMSLGKGRQAGYTVYSFQLYLNEKALKKHMYMKN